MFITRLSILVPITGSINCLATLLRLSAKEDSSFKLVEAEMFFLYTVKFAAVLVDRI